MSELDKIEQMSYMIAGILFVVAIGIIAFSIYKFNSWGDEDAEA